MTGGDLTLIVKTDRIPTDIVTIDASEAERRALAERFGLPAIHALSAEVTLAPEGGDVAARGRLVASYEQLCAVADEPFALTLDEPLAIRFVASSAIPDEDEAVEFDSDAPDEIEYDGAAFDLGEAVAQSFGLALDPYAEGPGADAARREAGLSDEDTPSGPFAALAALKRN